METAMDLLSVSLVLMIGIILVAISIHRLLRMRISAPLIEGTVSRVSQATMEVSSGTVMYTYIFPIIGVTFTYDDSIKTCSIDRRHARMYRESLLGAFGDTRPAHDFFWNSLGIGDKALVRVNRRNPDESMPVFPLAPAYRSETLALGIAGLLIILFGFWLV